MKREASTTLVDLVDLSCNNIFSYCFYNFLV